MKNKKVIGKFKDELDGTRTLEFVGLRPKMYSFRAEEKIPKFRDSDEVKKLKGLQNAVVNREIHFKHYKECLFNQNRIVSTQRRFQVKKHQVQSVTQNKISLSAYDDKRFLLSDNISSLAFGHVQIDK